MKNARLSAVHVLCAVRVQGRALSYPLLAQQTASLSDRDRAFAWTLCFGILRQYFSLQARVDTLIKRALKKKDQKVQDVLLVALYEYHFLKKPHYVVVNEAVKVAKILPQPWASRLVNACLRQYMACKPPTPLPHTKDIQAQYEHPLWIIRALQRAWPSQWETILVANQCQAVRWLRVNTHKITVPDYIKQLARAGVSAECGRYSPTAVRVSTTLPLSALPGHASGQYYVQDQGAQLACALLDLQANHYVLDACAAPGGKASHILAQRLPLKGLVLAEKDPERMVMLKQNLRGYHYASCPVAFFQGDACQLPAAPPAQPFDRILLDAPCSALGVIGRHPDIKLLRRSTDLPILVAEQTTLLSKMWSLLKPGGRLVYVTCSVLPEENEERIGAFLLTHPDAAPLALSVAWGVPRQYGRQLLPCEAHNGFYYAVLCKETAVK